MSKNATISRIVVTTESAMPKLKALEVIRLIVEMIALNRNKNGVAFMIF